MSGKEWIANFQISIKDPEKTRNSSDRCHGAEAKPVYVERNSDQTPSLTEICKTAVAVRDSKKSQEESSDSVIWDRSIQRLHDELSQSEPIKFISKRGSFTSLIKDLLRAAW